MRLLVVEDNRKLAEYIRQGMAEHGYTVDIATTAADGEQLAAEQAYDLLILDLMLPDQNGVTVCRNLRRRGVATPILMLTALSSTSDKVTGFDAGGDDYLTKPFEFDELVARVRALLRRGRAAESAVLRFDDLEMDLVKRCVARGGQKIRLTAREFSLLEYFLRNVGRVLTRTMIGEHVWEMNFDSDSNVIDVYVSTLRRKIEGGFPRRLIHTVIGAGYVLNDRPPHE